MAVYNVDYLDEQAQDSTDEMLDGMLEACDAMMQMVESTAAQRHYGITSKDYGEMYDSEPYSKATKYLDSKNLIGSMAVKNLAKSTNPSAMKKSIDRGVNCSAKTSKRLGLSYPDREREEDRVRISAATKGGYGALLGKAAKAGYDVKGAVDKARAKDAKKRAIKETCLNILSIIDEI